MSQGGWHPDPWGQAEHRRHLCDGPVDPLVCAIVDAFDAADLGAAQAAIRTHIESGKQIALDAIERAGGVL